MSAQARLDWRELAPAPTWHECDCDHCEMVGELEPVDWPHLIPISGDPDYVTDRFIAIRADLAPVPEGYEGSVLLPGDTKIPERWRAEMTDEPPTGRHFRWHIIKALAMTGWRLRMLAGDGDERALVVAVIDAKGERIGWTVAVREPREDDWDPHSTREYVEPTVEVTP